MTRPEEHPEACRCGGVGWLDSDTPCPGPETGPETPAPRAGRIPYAHHNCRWCQGTGFIETSRERQEVTRCPGDKASHWDIANLRHRAEEGYRRHMDALNRSLRGDGSVTGPPEDFGPRVLEAMAENRRRHQAALDPTPDHIALPQPQPKAAETAEPEEEPQLFDPNQM